MKSTFKVLFYVKKQSVKNGKAPVMGRITINGTQAGFSCKKEVSLALWTSKPTGPKASPRRPVHSIRSLTISRRKSPGTTSLFPARYTSATSRY